MEIRTWGVHDCPMQIVEVFQVSGRGLVVAAEETTDLPVARSLSARIVRPDGTVVEAEAFKEWLLRRNPAPIEKEAFLLRGLAKSDVPIGSDLHLELATKTEC